MRTEDETVEYYRKERESDIFGFTFEVLAPYLPTEKVKEFCKPDADWKQTPLDRETVLTEMSEYMELAWGKVEDHRGISASRSVEKMSAWLWLLGDEETLAFAKNNDNYTNYGAPVLKKICEVYGLPIPDSTGIRNMAQGKPCYEGCQEGCGK